MTSKSQLLVYPLIARVAAIAALALGVFVLARWSAFAFSWAVPWSSPPAMQPNGAVCFMLLGGALFLGWCPLQAAGSWRRRAALVFAAAATAVGGFALLENVFAVGPSFDTGLFRTTLTAPSATAHGRMFWPSSLAILLLGSGVLLLDVEWPRRIRPAQYCALLTLLLSILAVLGRIYHHEVAVYSRLSVVTGIVVILFSLGLLATRWNQGVMRALTTERPGGVMARRILPAVLMLPFLLGWLRNAAESGGVHLEFIVAALVIITLTIFGLAISWSARALNRIDAQRERARVEFEALEERLQTVVENIGEGIIIADGDGGPVMHWNRAALLMHDFNSLEEVKRRRLELPNIFEYSTLDGRTLTAEEWPLARIARGEKLAGFEYRARKRGTARERIFSASGARVNSPHGNSILFLTLADITEKHQAEEALATSQVRLRRILDGLPVATYTCDPDGLITYFNPQAAIVWGREPKLRDPADRFCGSFRLQRPDGASIAHDACWMASAVREKHAVDGHEIIIERPDGTHVSVLAHAHPLWDSAGKFTGAVNVLVDVTEEKKVERALREGEERFRQLAENINQVFWMRDTRSGKMLYVSPEYQTIFGRTSQSLLENPESWFDSIHPMDRPRIETSYRVNEGLGKYDEVFRIVRSDGRVRWLSTHSFPIRDSSGEVYRVGGIATDITDVHNAVGRLELQHEVMRVLADAAPTDQVICRILELIARKMEWDYAEYWATDAAVKKAAFTQVWHTPSTALANFSQLTREATSAPGEGLIGQVWTSGEPLWRGDLAETADFLRRDLAVKAGLNGFFGFAIRSGEKVVAVVAFLSARLPEPDHDLRAVFNLIGLQLGQFIERKLIEEQFRLAQKLDSVGHLAGGIAHDFNNMLGIIQGRVSLMNLHTNLPRELTESVTEISHAATRAATLTRQLLAFGRRQVLQLRNLDLNPTIEEMVKMLRRVLGADIILRFEPSPTPVMVHADTGMLDQVLLNLALNSREAMPRGGKLVIRTAAEKVDGAVVKSNSDATTEQFVTITVTDTGSGIAPEILPRIFEPFFTTKEVGKGPGLGLAMVYGIVKQHHGWITVSSEVGKGTVFKIFFPAVEGRIASLRTTAESASVRGRNETILLVEDEASLRMITQIILERHGYRVITADSGPAALAAWEKSQGEIDLVLTDIVMPDGMSGRDLGTRLQETKPSVKLIYASGYNATVVGKDFAISEGMNFLQKPFDLDRMLATIRKCLDEN